MPAVKRIRENKPREWDISKIHIIKRTAAAKINLHRMHTEDIIAIDMEFMMSERWPWMLQIALESGEIYLFDIIMCEDIMSLQILKSLLESKKTKKIIHGGDNDCKILWENCLQDEGNPMKIRLENAFDTQLVQKADDGIEHGKAEAKSLVDLCDLKKVSGINKELKAKYKKNFALLSEREKGEMSHEQIQYFAGDVAVLFPLYEALKSKLDNRQVRDTYDLLIKKHHHEHLKPGHVQRKQQEKKRKRRRRRLENKSSNLSLSQDACNTSEHK